MLMRWWVGLLQKAQANLPVKADLPVWAPKYLFRWGGVGRKKPC